MSALYLIDVSALAYRSFYAFINNPLKNSKGEETSAIYGFASHTLRLIQECQPAYLAFVKDLPRRTFRHEMYSEYKAHRKPMPEGLVKQLPVIDRFVEASGLKTISLEGYEADDVMAALACQARDRGIKSYIVTRDKDMMQLVGDDIFLFELGKANQESLVTGAKQVKEKMGVPPDKIVDYLSLIGDASDNVPGVPKIGPKTAVELLEIYGTLEGIYANVGNITKKGLRENLIAGKDSAFMSKRLVTLDCAMGLPLSLDELRYSGVEARALAAFIEEWELRSLLRLVPKADAAASALSPAGKAESGKPPKPGTPRMAVSAGSADAASGALEGNLKDTSDEAEALIAEAEGEMETAIPDAGYAEAPVAPIVPENLDYGLADSLEALAALVERLQASPVIAVDTETTSLDNKVADLVGLCLSVEAKTGWYLPLGHSEGRNLPLEEVRRALRPIFEDDGKLLVFHNAKYDLPILMRHGLVGVDFGIQGQAPADLKRPGKLADTMVAAYLSNPGERKLSLDDLALRHFGHAMIPIEALIGKPGRGASAPKQKRFSEVAIEEAAKYGAEDADITFRLWELYRQDLEEKSLIRLFFDLEMALLPVLIAVEGRGITLDTSALDLLSTQLKEEIARLEKEIHALAGEEFNIGSPTQLQVILFEKLGLKPGKRTKTGFSTDADMLSRLEGEHDIIAKLLDYRESSKLQNTYVEALPAMVHAGTSRIHTSYSQVIAATGRLSSVNPNLQNIPIRTELGRAVRKCFTAGSPDRLLLCADYSQIELRLLAHLSGDPTLREAYRLGLDIHSRTASALYKVDEGAVTAEMRRHAKVVNFGVLYGMGATRLASQLRIPRSEASRFIENYFASYASVERYMRDTVEKGRGLGYVETLAGRRRYLPDLLSDNRMFRENAERIAANTPIQGSAADLIKLAMIRIHREIKAMDLDCAMLLQVHDELVFEVHERDLERAIPLIKTGMEGAMTLDVPLVVEVGTGSNWLEAHP